LEETNIGFHFLSTPGGLSSCHESDFAEAISVDAIAGLVSINSETSKILNAGGIAGANGYTAARTFGTENRQEKYTATGFSPAGQGRIDGER